MDTIVREQIKEYPPEQLSLYLDPFDTMRIHPILKERGNGYGTLLHQLYFGESNPIVDTISTIPNPLMGTTDEKPIVWIVVPFQSTGSDGRNDQQTEFIRIMHNVRESLKDIVDLRIRFATQVFSSYYRDVGHPLSEKPYYISSKLFTPKFNRGILLNCAIQTIQNARTIFTHDVDLVPGNEISFQAYATEIDNASVLHLAGGWDRYNMEGRVGTYLGGITGMTVEGWKSVNGYPNDYFGWGGEDDELLRRVKHKGVTINTEFYDKSKFLVKDLEEIEDVEMKRKIVGTRDADNLVKNELKTLYESGTLTGGLTDVFKHTRIVRYVQHDDWIDSIDIVILPSAYTTLPESVYRNITREQALKDMYHEALYLYKSTSMKDWNESITVFDKKERDYLNMRLPVIGYGSGDVDTELIKRYRNRFTSLPKYKELIMDEVGAYSISYPETGEQMATIAKMLIGPNASVIDGTACLGGNTGYFAREFQKVTAIEINPTRADFVVHNLKHVYLADSPRKDDVIRGKSILDIAMMRLGKSIVVLDGDSQDVLLPRASDVELSKYEPLGEALFVDPPWGGPGYGYVDKRIGLEMTTRRYGTVTAAEYLVPILERAMYERLTLGSSKGILSRLQYVFMKVPMNYDMDELQAKTGDFVEITKPLIPIHDRTGRVRVFLVIMKIRPPLTA